MCRLNKVIQRCFNCNIQTAFRYISVPGRRPAFWLTPARI